MSYDITFLPKSAGTTAEQVETFLESYEGADGRADKVWARKAKIVAAALVAMNPELEEFEEGDTIELMAAEDAKGFAIDVSIFPAEVVISVPYWHGEEAEKLFRELWRYARLIIEKLDLVAYDHQTGMLWKSEADALASVEAYGDLAASEEE